MNTLDAQGLPDEQVQFLQELVAFLRQKHHIPDKIGIFNPTPKNEQLLEDETEWIDLCSWSLGVKEEIKREEIYDYLNEVT
jgi:hypothetical protein